MPKYNVSVKFTGSISYVVEAESKTIAESEVVTKFIERDLKNSNLNDYVDECVVEEAEEVK
jgi:hypothetical protein